MELAYVIMGARSPVICRLKLKTWESPGLLVLVGDKESMV